MSIAGVVDQQLNAYNARDIDAFMRTYSSQATICDAEGQLVFANIDHMREHYKAMFEASPNLRCTIVKRIVIGSYVIDEESVTGVRGNDAPVHAVARYRVVGDLIDQVMFIG